MLLADLPRMMFSEAAGWRTIALSGHPARWYRQHLVLPLAVLPPLLVAYAQIRYPGILFPRNVPPPNAWQWLVSSVALYAAQIATVSYVAMLIRRMAMARDHDPGPDAAYALAAIAPVPLWLSSLALLIPQRDGASAIVAAGLIASFALIRHGTRPLLGIEDKRTALQIADIVTVMGFLAWVGVLIVAAISLSLLLAPWSPT